MPRNVRLSDRWEPDSDSQIFVVEIWVRAVLLLPFRGHWLSPLSIRAENFFNDRAFNRPRVLRLSASWGINWGFLWNSSYIRVIWFREVQGSPQLGLHYVEMSEHRDGRWQYFPSESPQTFIETNFYRRQLDQIILQAHWYLEKLSGNYCKVPWKLLIECYENKFFKIFLLSYWISLIESILFFECYRVLFQ